MKIILKPNQNLYITSDTHYGHKNLCLGTSDWTDKSRCRKFNTIPEMNDVIVNRINEKVLEDDILIHLGDWSFGGFDNVVEFRQKIRCKNIILFLGNHDHHIKNNKGGVKSMFAEVTKYEVIDIRIPSGGIVNKHKLVAMHFPIHEWEGMDKGSPHIHGHSHLSSDQKISKKAKAMDVGVDGNDYYPYSVQEIIDLLDLSDIGKLILPKNHHSS